VRGTLDCFAPLAMTGTMNLVPWCFTSHQHRTEMADDAIAVLGIKLHKELWTPGYRIPT
jgi:hypothetical protein